MSDQTRWQQIEQDLTPEAVEFVLWAHDCYVRSAPQHRKFMYVQTYGPSIIRSMGPDNSAPIENFDDGILDDLMQAGLVNHLNKALYRLTGTGVNFATYLRSKAGEAGAQIEQEVLQTLGSDKFHERHPKVALELRDALKILRSGDLSEENIRACGTSLRNILTDVVPRVSAKNAEKPAAQLRSWINGTDLQERQRGVLDVLVTLVEKTQRLDQGAVHIKDEPDCITCYEELRRAVVRYSVLCLRDRCCCPVDRSA